jgi:antitoxin PrlF
MEIPLTFTSKGQITIPTAVRKALRLKAGDRVIFRVADGRALMGPAKTGSEETPG